MEYIVGSDIELTDLEINMLKGHGFKVWELDKMSKEELDEYGWEPFQFVLKTDLSTYMEADKDLIKLLEKKVYHDECVSVIESIMNELKQRTWQLRDFISWEKFINGQ